MELIANLRKKIKQLNSYNFTDTEWERFFHKHIANANEGIIEKTRTIQEDAVKNMERDDGSTKNITLLDKKNIHNNRLQVINKYEVSQSEGAKFDNRYDVTILVNGFPLIHVELKRRDVAIREAFNQIAATEKILNRIEIAANYKKLGSLEAGGYIWHTTGSGKNLSSFKTAQLSRQLNFVDKVLFVVDRKDLDYQTMKEYDRFQKGVANSNTSTAILKKQLEDDDARIIITTIQKLDHFIRIYKGHEVFDRHIVLVFDERYVEFP